MATKECCGNCAHSDEEHAATVGVTYCTKRDGFYNGRLMLKLALCPSWEPKE